MQFDGNHMLECQRLSGQFATLIDGRRFQEVVELFTENASFIRPDGTFRGRGEILAVLEKRPASLTTFHLCGLPLVKLLDAGEAEGYVPFVFLSSATQLSERDGSSPPSMTAAGHYLDRYLLTAGSWKIAERRIIVMFPQKPAGKN